MSDVISLVAPAAAPPAAAPLVVAADGARLTDDSGRTWLDARTGGFGPGHPAVTAALRAQIGRTGLSSRVLISRPLAAAVVALARFCPPPLDLSYLCSSGDEALDFALKLAKGTHPRRRTVLAVEGEDHGELCHGRSLTVGTSILPAPPLVPRSVAGGKLDGLPGLVDDDTAAVVLAPAAPGRRLGALDARWWRAVRRRCRETGALLVLDERLTGPARLGARLGCEALGVVPDVLVLGEPLGANAVPVGVTVTASTTYRRVLGHRNPTVHGSTFGANPLAAAAVTAVLTTVENDDLSTLQQAAERTLRAAFADLHSQAPVVEHGVDGSLAWVRLADAATADRFEDALTAGRVLPRRTAPDVVALLPPLTSDPGDIATLGATAVAALRGIDDSAEPTARSTDHA